MDRLIDIGERILVEIAMFELFVVGVSVVRAGYDCWTGVIPSSLFLHVIGGCILGMNVMAILLATVMLPLWAASYSVSWLCSRSSDSDDVVE